jgi:hypothetical protein
LWILAISALPVLPACPGSIDLEDSSTPHTIPGLGSIECPPTWEGDALPAGLLAALEAELTAAVSELKDAVQTEASLKGTGPFSGVKLHRLRLALTDPPAAPDRQSTFGFLASLALHVRPADAGSSLPVLLLAKAAAVDEEATTIDLEVSDLDLWPYLAAGLRITVTAPPRTCLREDLTFELQYIARIFF